MRITLKELLTEESYNSRFVYLFGSLAFVACIVALVVAFIVNRNNPTFLDATIYLIGVLLAGGGGGVGAIGRWITTKKVPSRPSERSEKTTVTETEKITSKKSK